VYSSVEARAGARGPRVVAPRRARRVAAHGAVRFSRAAKNSRRAEILDGSRRRQKREELAAAPGVQPVLVRRVHLRGTPAPAMNCVRFGESGCSTAGAPFETSVDDAGVTRGRFTFQAGLAQTAPTAGAFPESPANAVAGDKPYVPTRRAASMVHRVAWMQDRQQLPCSHRELWRWRWRRQRSPPRLRVT
jgi:hypothetical protein